MYRADLYRRSSSFQQEDAGKIFDEFLEFIGGDEFQTQLDIGCGPGDTLVNQILPKLPENTEVVGIDILEKMVNLATKKYQSENIQFFVNDIQSDFKEIQRTMENRRFDLVTSFYCYHWVRDERQALSNIYKLMNFGGKLVMIFPVHHIFMTTTLEQSRTKKYSVHLSDVENRFLSLYYFEENAVEAMNRRLGDAGFKVLHTELRAMNFTFESVEEIQNSFRAVFPFKMPDDVRLEFERECTMKMVDECTVEESGLGTRYNLMIVFATK